MGTPHSIEKLKELPGHEERLATKTRIETLTEKTRSFDRDHAAIVALQDTDEYVQPRVLCKMLAYSVHMRAFEGELATLDVKDINALVSTLGFPGP